MKKVIRREFRSLFLQRPSFIDVRAPVEFQAGAIPGAVNLPLLTDEERHQVGIAYKQLGQAAAIQVGHSFVQGELREGRIRAWLNHISAAPDSVIYCFRGGLRSQIVQQWVADRSVHCPIVEGGYKALRNFLIGVLETRIGGLEFEVVCGPTGSGKTEYIRKSGRSFLDLEALACHRGSAFGAMDSPQPSQIDFENRISVEVLRLAERGEPVLIENESRLIGRRFIPEKLYRKILSGRKIEIDLPVSERVDRIFHEYVLNSPLGTRGDVTVFQSFRLSLEAISRKLGGLRTQELLKDLADARDDFEAGRGLDANRIWIQKLIEWYYDPAYERSRKNSAT